MAEKLLSTDAIIALLGDLPSRIETTVAVLSDAQLQQAPAPGEWAASEVLAHLRSCADVWGGCMQTILDNDHPTFKAINPTSYIKSTDYPSQAFKPAFGAYKLQRSTLLILLQGLSTHEWARSATVTGAGRPLQRTIHSYANWLATHERSHIRQFKKIVRLLTAV